MNFQRAAQQGGPEGCRKGRAHVDVQPTGPPCCADRRPALLYSLPACRKFMIFKWKHGPPARPAVSLVLSATLCSTRSRINSKKHVIEEISVFTIVKN